MVDRKELGEGVQNRGICSEEKVKSHGIKKLESTEKIFGGIHTYIRYRENNRMVCYLKRHCEMRFNFAIPFAV